jgi:hypothetical protein
MAGEEQYSALHFPLDSFLAHALADVPLRADYIGADPRNASSTPASPFPAQWRDVCALTTPPNGFASVPWWNDKVQRKHEWQAMGVESRYIVPTLYHTYVSTEMHYPDTAGFVEDDSGVPALSWDQPKRIHKPHDAHCQAALKRMLRSHRSFVLKPIEGNRAEGVQLVRTEVDGDSDDPDPAVTVRRHTSEASLIKTKDGERMSFSDWFRQCVIENHDIKSGILAEPLIEWDNEVTCISLAGGKLVVMGSKGGGLVRSGFAEAGLSAKSQQTSASSQKSASPGTSGKHA